MLTETSIVHRTPTRAACERRHRTLQDSAGAWTASLCMYNPNASVTLRAQSGKRQSGKRTFLLFFVDSEFLCDRLHETLFATGFMFGISVGDDSKRIPSAVLVLHSLRLHRTQYLVICLTFGIRKPIFTEKTCLWG